MMEARDMRELDTGLIVPKYVAEAMPAVTPGSIEVWKKQLLADGKAKSTVEAYGAALRNLSFWNGTSRIDKYRLREHIDGLERSSYSKRHINQCIAAINSYLTDYGRQDLKLKHLKIDKSPFRDDSKDLTDGDVDKLIQTAKEMGDHRMVAVILILRGTGIRVSEIPFFTVEEVSSGIVTITNKGKTSSVVVSDRVRAGLLDYAKKAGITSGPIIRYRDGKRNHRQYIHTELKALADKAGVPGEKVFPHNFRHLFATSLYRATADLELTRQALRHESLVTTMIYLQKTATQYREDMGKAYQRMKEGFDADTWQG